MAHMVHLEALAGGKKLVLRFYDGEQAEIEKQVEHVNVLIRIARECREQVWADARQGRYIWSWLSEHAVRRAAKKKDRACELLMKHIRRRLAEACVGDDEVAVERRDHSFRIVHAADERTAVLTVAELMEFPWLLIVFHHAPLDANPVEKRTSLEWM